MNTENRTPRAIFTTEKTPGNPRVSNKPESEVFPEGFYRISPLVEKQCFANEIYLQRKQNGRRIKV